jgi:hypothetical protein
MVTSITMCGRRRDMQDTELLLSLAEIAGVFVGFAALISVRSGGASEAEEVTYIRWVVTLGVWVVIAAIAPIIVGRYGVTGHELWLVCSLLSLVLYLGLWIVNERTTEAREAGAVLSRAQTVGVMAFFLAFIVPVIAALVLVVLGLFPDQEPALYLTAVGLVLSMGAFTLLLLVVSQRRLAAAPGPAALAATGGSSA